jgi:hypothetical protein
MKKILLFLASAALAFGQTVPVVPIPYPRFVSTLQNGSPNAFGCVFTYAVNTNTPLATYTDGFSGTLNPNPVPLSAGGTASIWLQVGSAYSVTVKTNGGTNCASGATVYTVNGLAGGSTTQTVVVPFSATPTFVDTSQNMLFQITLTGNAVALPFSAVGIIPPGFVTFQIIQDSVGGHSFTWPANIIGGAPINLVGGAGGAANQTMTQEFVWNGLTLTALGPGVYGNGPAISTGAISANGNLSIIGNINGTGSVQSTNQGTELSVANSSGSPPAQNSLVVITGGFATLAPTTATTGVIGACQFGCHAGGQSTTQQSGIVSCNFDGSTTNGDYVEISNVTAGDCHDSGLTTPSIAGQVIGQVLSTNSAAGTYAVALSAGGGGSSSSGDVPIASIAAFSGAGTGGTAVCGGEPCYDLGGFVQVSTGSSPQVDQPIWAVNFGGSHLNSFCTFSPANATAAALSGSSMPTISAPTTEAGLTSGSGALAASTVYQWFYTCTFH